MVLKTGPDRPITVSVRSDQVARKKVEPKLDRLNQWFDQRIGRTNRFNPSSSLQQPFWELATVIGTELPLSSAQSSPIGMKLPLKCPPPHPLAMLWSPPLAAVLPKTSLGVGHCRRHGVTIVVGMELPRRHRGATKTPLPHPLAVLWSPPPAAPAVNPTPPGWHWL